jgi:glycosyltransferase involved in cell wall biosynthesis
MITISLVCTVKNEADNIAALLDSMLAQTLLPNEIVINDCGSRDHTSVIVTQYIAAGHPIRLVQGGHNIPSGRNNAIQHANGAIIACTDAGLTLDPQWLEEIVAPLVCGSADVVGGFFRPAPQSLFELAVGATNYREASEIDPETFLPFGKSVAFRKSAWAQVGGYPEWANYCEDLLFDLQLKQAGVRFAFAPNAMVFFRPRESLAAFARQYYNYASGDGSADLWQKRHLIRYATYLLGAALTLAALRKPIIAIVHLIGIAGYCAAPLRRLRQRAPALTTRELLYAVSCIPVIRVVGDLAKMVGYPVGIKRRLQSVALQEAVRAYKNPSRNLKSV